MRLGVNIDHVATLRQARRVSYPSVLDAALISIEAGADLITVHLREDRRHIQDADVICLRKEISVPLNLEMALTEPMLHFACQLKPDWVCLVPEKREEITTEGGLDVIRYREVLSDSIMRLHDHGIRVSPFIDPDQKAIEVCALSGADAVELHTGDYANASTESECHVRLSRLIRSASYVRSMGLGCHAGHGLTIYNVSSVAAIPEIEELNIGHSIIADAVFVGLENAVRRMKAAIHEPIMQPLQPH